MNQKIVTLKPGQTLVVEWAQNWSNLSIHKDGILIGSVAEKADLKVGRRFVLPGGGEIMIMLANHGLELWHENKELVSGMRNGEVDGFARAYKALYFAGSMELVLTLFSLMKNRISRISYFKLDAQSRYASLSGFRKLYSHNIFSTKYISTSPLFFASILPR